MLSLPILAGHTSQSCISNMPWVLQPTVKRCLHVANINKMLNSLHPPIPPLMWPFFHVNTKPVPVQHGIFTCEGNAQEHFDSVPFCHFIVCSSQLERAQSFTVAGDFRRNMIPTTAELLKKLFLEKCTRFLAAYNHCLHGTWWS